MEKKFLCLINLALDDYDKKMKCKTCAHWYDSKYGLGKCKGIFGRSVVMNIGENKKTLMSVRSGVIVQATYVMTPSDWYCKNWKKK
jgi:hypothetical protein